ncbi:MAG: precorrin-2 C(20)-methyltransferase [Deltaproteobacteria bacterium]|jgi:precorrin-2/cobalt-factor-2 C20-methyltransferase|nr:precorrin-2 C(20)-methyltransferase [Deltaproteobacteria bacterium]
MASDDGRWEIRPNGEPVGQNGLRPEGRAETREAGREENREGTLYGIGVGPGDPSLITLKAVQLLGQVDHVFTASTSETEDSLAGNIAAPHVREGVEVIKLVFPMTVDGKRLEEAWLKNAKAVVEVLDEGRSAAFLTLGDCLTYSTYAYLLRYLFDLKPSAKVVSVPGITSYQLAAAKLNRPLVLGRENLTIFGGALDANFERLCQASDNLVIMKPYRDMAEVTKKLKDLGLAGKTALCANLALAGETIIDGLDQPHEEPSGYFSLLLVNKREEG